MAELEEARCVLARSASTLTNLGLMTAEIYVRSAVGNVGIGLEALLAARARRQRHCDALGQVSTKPILVAEDRNSSLGVRLEAPDLRRLPARPISSLAVDLMNSVAARKFVKDGVSAGLLCSALWQCRWFHPRSGVEWSVDRHGACLLISLLTGGRSFPSWSMKDLAGLVDGECVRLIASLGWTRLRSSELGVASQTGSS